VTVIDTFAFLFTSNMSQYKALGQVDDDTVITDTSLLSWIREVRLPNSTNLLWYLAGVISAVITAVVVASRPRLAQDRQGLIGLIPDCLSEFCQSTQYLTDIL
jgi:hypothetical protein